eukprot:8849531-Pyramimonas_sp.AAC.1
MFLEPDAMKQETPPARNALRTSPGGTTEGLLEHCLAGLSARQDASPQLERWSFCSWCRGPALLPRQSLGRASAVSTLFGRPLRTPGRFATA